MFVEELTTANQFMVTLLAVVLALAVGALLVIIADEDARGAWSYLFADPLEALSFSWYAVRDAYVALFEGAIFDPSSLSSGNATLIFGPISETLTYTAPLIFTGLSVALAFRAGLFNIGAEGQVIFGAIFGALVGFSVPLPYGLHLIFALLAAAVGGALWGFIPGILKARTGAHEVITTIMLNYIAGIFLVWLVTQPGVQDPNRTDAISKKIDATADLPNLAGEVLRVNLAIVLAIIATVGVSWLLNRSTFGFELRAVGANPDAARTAGMSISKSYILVMVVAGALAALGGGSVLLGTAQALTPAVSANIGFDGITVALLGRARPWGVVGAALLIGALQAGAVKMQATAGIPIDMVNVLQALIVLFIAAPALIKAVFRLRPDTSERAETALAKGW
ncbi:MAG: ABC transporter permease [Longispora sp.]|nr:ABC transporter permease [Longispora sp. (in: high G+C Gram-positive bacteria)]